MDEGVAGCFLVRRLFLLLLLLGFCLVVEGDGGGGSAGEFTPLVHTLVLRAQE